MARARLSDRALAGLAAVVIAALVVLVWRVRASSTPPQPAAQPGTAPASRSPAPAPGSQARPELPRGDGARFRGTEAPATGAPLGEDDGGDVPMAEILRTGRAVAVDVARACATGDAGRAAAGQSVTVRYTITVTEDEANLDRVEAVTHTITDDALLHCILAALEAAHWDVPGARPSQRRSQQSIRIADLLR